MDAVAFMESSKRQPQAVPAATAAAPPPDRRPFMSVNASLVAGVATLVLAMGVGVLIGRSAEGGSSNAAAPAPQIIRVGGEGSGAASTVKSRESKGATSGGGKTRSATKKRAAKKLETGKSGATRATEEAYEPAPGVKIAPPEQKLGGECDPSVAGCGKNGKFEGEFFE